MNPTLTTFVLFAFITFVILAIAFLIRDLFFAKASAMRGRLGTNDDLGLPRLPLPSDDHFPAVAEAVAERWPEYGIS